MLLVLCCLYHGRTARQIVEVGSQEFLTPIQ